MSDERAAKLTIINRLLASFPSTQAGLGDDALDGYEIGLADIPAEFIAIAAQRFLSGQVPGQHTAFPPSPAQLATEARDHWYRRIDDENRRRKRLELPAPQLEHSPEARARVAAMAEDVVKRASEQMRTGDAEKDRRMRDLSARTNSRFQPDMSPDAVRQRLGFTVGDPDGDADAA